MLYNAPLLAFQKGTKHLHLVMKRNVILGLRTYEAFFFLISIVTISADFK